MSGFRTRLTALLLGLYSSWAWACPACAAQQTTWTATLKLLGGMLVLPFVVAGIVIWAVRRAVLKDRHARSL